MMGRSLLERCLDLGQPPDNNDGLELPCARSAWKTHQHAFYDGRLQLPPSDLKTNRGVSSKSPHQTGPSI